MADELMLPPYLYPTSVELEKVDSAGAFQPIFGYAVTQRIDYGATRWRAKLTFEKLRTSERHELLAFLTKAGRLKAFCTPAYGEARRGVGAFPELFTNPTFDGTTGWSNINAVLTAAGRAMRVTAASNAEVDLFQSIALTQYAPHVLRTVILDGRGTSGLSIGPAISSSTFFTNAYSAARGMKVVSLVPETAGSLGQYPAVILAATGFLAGDYVEVPWCSLSRCALVDNGPNALVRSDAFDNAAWNKSGATITLSETAPDGTTEARALIESAINETHAISQAYTVSASAADYVVAIAAKPNGRDWILLQMREGTGSTDLNAWFNVATGAVGTTALGANWSNLRTFIRSLGNGWYVLWLVGRKTNAATSIEAIFRLANADGVQVYAGNGVSGLRIWRATSAQSSVPTRLVQTVGTALPTGTSQALSGSLHTKGWFPSTNELLAAGDLVNVVLPNGLHLARLTSALNTDAAGLGHLQFEPALPESPADNAVVIPNQPLLKCVLVEVPRVRTYPPGFISDVELTAEGVFG